MKALASRFFMGLLVLPIRLYRFLISPFLPGTCRHLPSCSAYAEQALKCNGPWKGSWLALSRLLRCHPWGSAGYDPVPDLRMVHHPWWAPWRYGRWTGRHICHTHEPTQNRPSQE